MRKLLCIGFILICLTGCSFTYNVEQFSKEAADVLSKNIDEEFTYVGGVLLDEETDSCEYHFKSTVRDLDIAVTTKRAVTQMQYTTDYHKKIKALYYDDVIAYLAGSGIEFNVDNSSVIVALEDIEKASEILAHCNQIYSVENQFHDDNFTIDHPLMDVNFVSPAGEIYYTCSIDGTFLADDIAYYAYEMYDYKVEKIYEED